MKVTSNSTLVVTKGGKPHDIAPGTPVDIDDDEARDLIARGIAVKVAKAEAPAPTTPDPARNNGGDTGQGGRQ